MKQNVEITTGALAFFCLLFYVNPWGIFFPFVFSAAAHELGHVAACWLLGGRLISFRVSMAGAELRAEFFSFWSEVVSVLAGPAVNLALMAAFWSVKPQVALVNLCLAAYNLLPVYPLDGGRVLYLFLFRWWPGVADRVMKIVTVATTVGIGIWGILATCVWHYGLWPCLIAALLMLKTGAVENSLAK